MSQPIAPATAPHWIAEETWLIPRLAPAGPEGFVCLNSMLIRGAEPVLVDTGAEVHREQWQEDVFSLVDPVDVRWVFVSHKDADHVGNLDLVLELCPNATVVTEFLGSMKLGVMQGLAPQRCRWLNPGEHLDVGDRVLTAVTPPLFDSAGTRGVLDSRTGVLWAADCFAMPLPGPAMEAGDLPADLWPDAFREMNSFENPWHAWLDADAFGAQVDAVAALPITAAASCHGPVLRGDRLREAFAVVRGLAGAPVAPTPGQPVLDEIVAAAMAAAAGAIPVQDTPAATGR